MNAIDLKTGETATISVVNNGKFQRKLIEMGCFEGNLIKKLYHSPLGDPIAFDINGYILGLRKEEAQLIQVVPF